MRYRIACVIPASAAIQAGRDEPGAGKRPDGGVENLRTALRQLGCPAPKNDACDRVVRGEANRAR